MALNDGNRGGMALAAAALVAAQIWGGAVMPVTGQPADANVLVSETFAGGEAALARWEFRGSPKANLSVGPAGAGTQAGAAYVDFRERADWRLLLRQPVTLRAGEQYTLSARVRRNLGYGNIRLIAEATGEATPKVLAQAEVINRNNTRHELAVVFRVPADTDVRLGFDASGYAEIWIESIQLRQNVPPLSSYATGMLLTGGSPTAQVRFRTGVFLEAEDIVAVPEAVVTADVDGDGAWALCRLDPARNPWLFSDDTVLKSDTLAAEGGGNLPPLKLTASGLLPGPYEVILSDPQRDAAVSLDGRAWRRVKGGAGEVNLGLIDVRGNLSVWVAHRFLTEANPGPIYVDYLRLMPVYDPWSGIEQPMPLAAAPTPAPVQRATLRLCQTGGVPRRQEWTTAGMPFARGVLRPGDGIRIADVVGLATQPLVLWPDGSIKWLRLQFQADAGAAGRELPVEYGRGVPPAAALPARGRGPAGQTFRCGEIEVTVREGVWDRLAFAGKPLIVRSPSVRLRTAAGLHCERLRVESVTLTSDGGRQGASVKGHLLAGDGNPAPLAFQALLTETAPQTLGLRFSILNESGERYEPGQGCSPAIPLTELAVVLDGILVTPETVQWPTAALPFDGKTHTLLQGGAGACVAEFQGKWGLHMGEGVAATGERTDGWLDLRGAGAGLALGVREFVERSPQSLTVRKAESGVAVEIGLWPNDDGRVFRFAQGTRLTTEIALVPHDGNLAAPDREARLASVLDPLHAALTPAYYCRTGVFGPVTEARDSRFEAYYASAAQTLKTLRSRHMKYGIEDWGDYFDRCGYVRTESNLFTNMEWNFVAALVVEFVRTGDPEFWRAAQQAARHFVDADVAHCSSTPAWAGGSYVHTGDTREGHQVDPPDFAHAGWPEGLLWVYYMAGDERLREASVGLADYVVRNMPPDGPYQAQPPFSMWNCDRQAGNPILTLASVYEVTRDPGHRRALNRLVDFALRAQDPKLGCWSTPFYEEPAYHRPSPYWGAVLLRGLHLYWEMTGDARVTRAFRRLGDFHLGRHAPETRRDLKPGSYYRTDFSYVAEACAFASLFTDDPEPLIAKGLASFGARFSATAPLALGARGAPGGLIGACRLAAAAAAQGGKPATQGGRPDP